MQIAFHHIVKRKSTPVGDDIYDLKLLDQATGTSRTLIKNVFYMPSSWSADGMWLRFQQHPGPRQFIWREVNVETGQVRDFTPPPLPSAWPWAQQSTAFPSPNGMWIAYLRWEHINTIIGIGTQDGQRLWRLMLPFRFAAFHISWSPCGTRLAINLTAAENTGVYIFDLTNGERQLMTPPIQNADLYDYQACSGWTPCGCYLQGFTSSWHDHSICDYECLNLWLIEQPGILRYLTDDDLSLHPAVRPDGPGPENREASLDFAWGMMHRDSLA